VGALDALSFSSTKVECSDGRHVHHNRVRNGAGGRLQMNPTTLVLVPGCGRKPPRSRSHWGIIDTDKRTAKHSSGEAVEYSIE